VARALAAAQCAAGLETENCPVPTDGTSSEDEASAGPPLNCARYTVELLKPIGIVLEETKGGGEIYVAEVVAGGRAARRNAESDALAEGTDVRVGDVLVSTSAVATTNVQTYGEVDVRGGEKFVTLSARGESFDTVLAAVASHRGGQPVRLTFQRCFAAEGGAA